MLADTSHLSVTQLSPLPAPPEPRNHTGNSGLRSCARARWRPRPNHWPLLCTHSGLAPPPVHLHTTGLYCHMHSQGRLWSRVVHTSSQCADSWPWPLLLALDPPLSVCLQSGPTYLQRALIAQCVQSTSCGQFCCVPQSLATGAQSIAENHNIACKICR